MNSTGTKKTKLVSETEEIDTLQQYLAQCPVLSKNSRILQIATTALEQERTRIERDARLQRKFSNSNSRTTTSMSSSSAGGDEPKAETSKPATTPTQTGASRTHESNNNTIQHDHHDDELMEWQDVPAVVEHNNDAPHASDGSLLGRRLAQEAIASMAQSRVQVSSPLGALALVLHAALCGDVLQFRCTGIPEIASAPNTTATGFAPPIRELPKGQLVPDGWEPQSDTPYEVAFRYRKTGVGATVLRVAMMGDNHDNNSQTVQVLLTPSRASTDEPANTLVLALSDHVNLESLAKAKESNTATHTTPPALHYKSLPVLMTKLCNTFDLGPVEDAYPSIRDDMLVAEGREAPSALSLPYVDTTIVKRPCTTTSITDPLPIPSHSDTPRRYDQHATPTIRGVFPDRPHRGDFDSDLTPSGMIDPNAMPGMGGNLMGPSHPTFGNPPDFGRGSGMGMRPRFDPFGPPGGPMDIQPPPNGKNNNSKGRRPPPGGPGDPNPDHQRTPSDLGNNMFL